MREHKLPIKITILYKRNKDNFVSIIKLELIMLKTIITTNMNVNNQRKLFLIPFIILSFKFFQQKTELTEFSIIQSSNNIYLPTLSLKNPSNSVHVDYLNNKRLRQRSQYHSQNS